MRYSIHEDEMEDYREQIRIERWEAEQRNRNSREAWRERWEPGYVPRWERESDE